MASISKGGGPSFSDHEMTDPERVRRAVIGDDRPSRQEVGTDSSTSSASPQKTNDDENPSPLSPVPTTQNPSNPVLEDPSIVDTMDGHGPKTAQPQSDKAAPKRVKKTAQARVRPVTEFDEFE